MQHGTHARRLTHLVALLAGLGFAPSVHAQTVDLRFSPTLSIVQVGDFVDVQLVAFADGVVPVEFSAIDAILDWDPQHLLFTGIDDGASSATWFVSSFLLDPDGINADLTDGDALYTALVQPGIPGVASPSGSVITTLQFIALAETAATILSLTPTAGVFGVTAVYAYDTPGATVTGDTTGTATIQIVGAPVAYCFGEPADCPCANPGGPGEGCANSTGVGALLQATGSNSVSADDLVLVATQVKPSQFGMFIVGGGQNDIPFGDGLRCVVPGPTGLHRFKPPIHSGPTATMTFGPGIVAHSQAFFPPAGQLQAGQTYYFQAWYRDPVGGPCGSTFNLSNGLAVTFTF